MTTELMTLSRRAIACTNWRWMPGMKDMEGWRLYREVVGFTAQDKDGKTVTGWDAIGGEWEYHQVAHFPKLPDLSDPATLGCLLAIIREVYSDPCACVIPIDYGPAGVMWQVRLTANGRQVTERHYTTEIEALVAVLECANE